MIIKKFNESFSINLKEVLDDCFLYISDETKIYTTLDDLGENSITTIHLRSENNNIENIDDLIKVKSKNLNVLNLTKDSIDRLKEYLKDSTITYKTSINEVVVRVSLNKQSFYFRKGKLIVLDKEKLLEIMSIEDTTKVSISSDGSWNYLNINFDSKEVLDRNRLSINNISDNLKQITIEDEPIFKNIRIIAGIEKTSYIDGFRFNKNYWGIEIKLDKKNNYTIK